MNHAELAYVNQQLASMLRCGIPLEGGLRQLCANMRRGALRAELEGLEADLAAGLPLAKAAGRRKLPQFYTRLLELGARGNDLSSVLTMLADYYEKAGAVWTQLKGLMVYPVIVLVLSLAFSVWAAFLGHQFAALLHQDRFVLFRRAPLPIHENDNFLWLPPMALLALAIPVLAMLLLPSLRRAMAWRLPAFREGSLCRAASALAVLLRAGAPLPEALGLMEQMHRGTPAGADFALWKTRCSEGAGKFADAAAGSRIFPPMFVWLVAGAGEDMASGFERAAHVYAARAAYRANVLLYAALPVSLLFLGLIILSQIYPVGRLIFELPRFFLGL
ncbi:MAG TPA: type II secretion system F family protein [Verrucomicrobiae bacterium]|jgi:type II secretory pathway component PulF